MLSSSRQFEGERSLLSEIRPSGRGYKRVFLCGQSVFIGEGGQFEGERPLLPGIRPSGRGYKRVFLYGQSVFCW
jgi:hypothetical protein